MAICKVILIGSLSLAYSQAYGQGAGPVPFRKQQLNPQFYSEGINFGDLNRDGKQDIIAGPHWYPGPAFTQKLAFRQPRATPFPIGGDSDCYSIFVYDFNQDGWPDLVVAVEWGPVKVFWNNQGRFTPAPGLGFDRYYSRWLGLGSGDWDADGRPDLVVTSWGRNVQAQADSARPLYLYFGNFGASFALDLLLAQEDPRLGGVAPLAGFARLSRAVPEIAQRLRTFHRYADATVPQVLGPAAAQAPSPGLRVHPTFRRRPTA